MLTKHIQATHISELPKNHKNAQTCPYCKQQLTNLHTLLEHLELKNTKHTKPCMEREENNEQIITHILQNEQTKRYQSTETKEHSISKKPRTQPDMTRTTARHYDEEVPETYLMNKNN